MITGLPSKKPLRTCSASPTLPSTNKLAPTRKAERVLGPGRCSIERYSCNNRFSSVQLRGPWMRSSRKKSSFSCSPTNARARVFRIMDAGSAETLPNTNHKRCQSTTKAAMLAASARQPREEHIYAYTPTYTCIHVHIHAYFHAYTHAYAYVYSSYACIIV